MTGFARFAPRCPLFVIATLIVGNVASADWPQWMGANRDNRPGDLAVPVNFETPPSVVWRSPAAGGYSGPAVVDGKLFFTDYVTAGDVSVSNFERNKFSGIERVRCLDATTGDEVWKHEYPVTYTVSYPAGPRCTPNVDGDYVYTLGTEGNLFCFAAATGDIVWSKNLVSDYGTKTALWGYASHPLIDGNQLICLVGGDGSHVVAFDKLTGEELWKHGSAPEQGYSPPTIIETGGTRQLIITSPASVSGLNPSTGEAYWTTSYEATNGSIIMSPVKATVDGQDYLYVAGYSNKNLLLKLSSDKPAVEVVWRDLRRKAVSPVNVQPILDDNVLYGFDQSGSLMAIDLPSGDRLWNTAQPLADRRPLQTGTAFIMATNADDTYLMFSELGDLVLAKMTPAGFEEIDRTHVIEPTGVAFGRNVVWSAPAVDGSRLFIRNDKEIICVDLLAD